jgi:hypothetical protein
LAENIIYSTLNKSFTIQGHTEIFGKNTTLISGGTKDEYPVLSQGDIDKGVRGVKFYCN